MNSNNDTYRLDVLVSNKAGVGREQAKELIKKGHIKVNNKVVNKSGQKFLNDIDITINMPKHQYVSRGGYKLYKALDTFNINVKNKVCIDIGASTGGFTDCLLQKGASIVYAIDSGKDQLSEALVNDNRVISMEQTNIRNINIESLNVLGDIIVVDVSFISLTKVLDKVFLLTKNNGICVCLIKPQFEAGYKNLNKKGVVKNKKVHLKVLEQIYDFAYYLGFSVKGLVSSPIEGKNGNKEYLIYLSKYDDITIDKHKFINLAFAQL